MSRCERNRALAIRWFDEVWNERKKDTVDEIMAAGCEGHMEGLGAVGRDDFRTANAALLDAFPDLSVEVEDTLAEGDHVVVRWRLNATHSGGGLGVPPTGRAVEAQGMTWFTFEDGRIVRGRDAWNQGALMAALTGENVAAAT